jgi:hypothetical protein
MAILKNTTINDTGNLRLPVGTTAQRPTPVAGQFRYNTTTNGVEIYTGGVNLWQPAAARGVRAAGGTVYDVDVEGTTYRVHVFTATGNSTFTVTRPGTVEYLIVAGGGSGGLDNAGGGGAGGLLTGATTVSPQAYTITVGAGGINNQLYNYRGPAGSNSSAFGLTAFGGGGGGGGDSGGAQSGTNFANSQLAGGSGGSGGGGASEGGDGAGGLGTTSQGNNGGAGLLGSGGGGGGAGSSGTSATAATNPGNGGSGIASSITGVLTFYAGGGGGGTENSANAAADTGVPGLGGGFGGALNRARTPGTPNSGGGGGGEANGNPTGDGSGGSGIVVIRYPLQSEPDVAQPTVSTNGLVLDLDFAKPTVYSGAGTVVNDSRVNGLTGTLVNTPIPRDIRTHRSSFNFLTASAHHISVTPINRTNTMSFEVWFNTSSTSTNTGVRQYLYTQQRNPPTIAAFTYMERHGLMITGNILQTQYFNGTNDANALTGTTVLSPNVWYCASVVINGTNNRMFINGVLEATSSGVSAASLTVNQAFIGRRGDSQGEDYFGGLIGLVRDYNRALTDAEVLNNFNATRWRFGI